MKNSKESNSYPCFIFCLMFVPLSSSFCSFFKVSDIPFIFILAHPFIYLFIFIYKYNSSSSMTLILLFIFYSLYFIHIIFIDIKIFIYFLCYTIFVILFSTILSSLYTIILLEINGQLHIEYYKSFFLYTLLHIYYYNKIFIIFYILVWFTLWTLFI